MMTTTYGEADILCDRIGIMNRGQLATIGSHRELKSAVGGDIITISSSNPGCIQKVKELGFSTITNSSEGNCDLIVTNGESSSRSC